MKQHTDSERLDWLLANCCMVVFVDGEYHVRDSYGRLSGNCQTPRAAIDDAMNREAVRTTNEQEE